MKLNQIALALTEYRDGDILGLSDIQDMFSAFGKELPATSLRARISDLLGAYLGQKLSDGKTLNREFLSTSVDLLTRLERVSQFPDPKSAKDLEAAVKIWREKHLPFLQEAQAFRRAQASENKTGLLNKLREQKDGISVAEAKAAPVARASKAVAKLDADNIAFLSEEVFRVFIMEAKERLALAQELCLAQESDPNPEETIQQLFRIFHTFKGECGFFKLASMGELAHHFESLLDLVRQKKLTIDNSMNDLLFSGIDRFNVLLDSLEKQNITIFNDIEIDDLTERIENQISTVHLPIGERLVRVGALSETDRLKVLQSQKEGNFNQSFGEITVQKGLLSPLELEQAAKQTAENPALPPTGQSPATFADQYIKVQASQISFLVDMIGELTIAQSQLRQNDPALGQLTKITREIQACALRLRTTKLKLLFINMHRGLRDVAQKLGKDVEFQTFGEDIEVDRNLVETLAEPLLHIIRNAVHHGIEKAAERTALGKSGAGKISLGAERRGNTIVISITDDGNGLDRDRIRDIAIQRGLVSADHANDLSDSEIYNFIFLPGFSTSREVGIISGRGVGMDIVKNFVAKNRGKLELETQRHQFTRLSMIFPINTAIVDGMLVAVGKLIMVIPVSQVIETLPLEDQTIHPVNSQVDILNRRGQMLPVINLMDYFGEVSATASPAMGVVVEDSLKDRFLFAVDRLIGKREVVIKSLGNRFTDLKAINSGTALAGGHIAYVIDTEFIINDRKR